MGAIEKLFKKRLKFDDWLTRNITTTKEIVVAEYYAQYGTNHRGENTFVLTRANGDVDIPNLYPKGMKCVFFVGCKGDTMPPLPDTVETINLMSNFVKFPHRFPKNLKELYLSLFLVKTMPDLSYLKHLWSLDINNKYPEHLSTNLPDSIQLLTVSDSCMKSSLKRLPKNLVFLDIANSPNLHEIPDLSYLKKLKGISVDKHSWNIRNFIKHNNKPIFVHENTRKMGIYIWVRNDP